MCTGCSSLMNCDIVRKQLPHPWKTGKSSLHLLLHCFFSSETQPLLPPPKGGQRRKGTPHLTHSISLLPTPHVNIKHPVLIMAVHINEWNDLLEQWASIMSWPPGVVFLVFLLASQPVPFFCPIKELVNPRAHVWLSALPREEVGKAAPHQRVFTTCWASAAVTNAARWAQSYASLSPSKPFTSASLCTGCAGLRDKRSVPLQRRATL